MIIHPYKPGSKSVKALKGAIVASGTRALITQRPPRRRASVVNWGGRAEFLNTYRRVLNRPNAIAGLRDKLAFFQRVGNDERTLPWTTDPKVASQWKNVFVRKSLTGSSGQGIVVWQQKAGLPLPPAPLYTKRMFTTHEYRIHVFREDTGEFHAIDTQRKVFKKTGELQAPPGGWAIRSHANGFTFVHNDVPPTEVVEGVCNFVREHFPDLDFGAFDVLYDADKKRFYVIEGNSAPGLEGITVDSYVRAIKRALHPGTNMV